MVRFPLVPTLAEGVTTLRRFTLFRVFGFHVRADPSWLIIAALVTWSLAAGVFPMWSSGLPSATYWIMGVIGAIGLFASILAHELCHSLMGRVYGMRIEGITLWLFGGIAEATQEAESPGVELLVAGVGPLSSLALSAAFYGIHAVGSALAWPVAPMDVLAYLAWVNLVLALFNLIPAFPMDGGRILRSLLWRHGGDLLDATRTASRFGEAFGILLMISGFLVALTGGVVGGIWWILIGSFVRAAARGSYTRTVIRSVLDDAPVRRLMEPEVTPVEAGASLSRFAEDYVYRTGPRRFPVADEGEIIGYVDAEAVRDVPRREWDSHTVRELVHELSDDDVIPADATAGEAMRKLEETRQRSLVVTDAGHVEGVVTVDALTRYASNRVDLEDLRE